MIENKRFDKVLDDLKKKKGITHTQVGEKLSNYLNINVDTNEISKIKRGCRALTSDMINAMYELYNVQPEYLRGESEIMYDNTSKYLKTIRNYIDWDIVEKKKTDENGKEVSKDFLRIRMKRSFYDCMVSIAQAELRQNEGALCFEEEVKKIIKICNEAQSDEEEFVILPTCVIDEECVDYPSRKDALDEVVDMWDTLGFFCK